MQSTGSNLLHVHERDPNLHTSAEVEHVVESGESIPVEPTDIGGMAVAAAAELPDTPEVDVQRLESERKKNTTENLRSLKSRFGERFVKGDLMEGGGFTGGAARELLAGFMDRPGFADELKRLIPGKHGALALLKDNHAYIQATLDQHYKDDPSHERQPAKDPYELARSVGYELTGPFTSTGEFVPLDKQDFRTGERLCTFNSPDARLRDYNILWLRHAEVADTLPADELTADNLSDAWKTYLKTIGRYDQDSDTYNLADLCPARDDPYGTSSMSVQISRQGTHVSVKNRYNHTVGNPDNTLDSDLDNVSYGLRRAIYTRVGREDLMDKTSVVLAEGYIADNEGGIHAYKYEEDNVYYGDYEYISNGVVTAIDRGKYYMVSPQLYVPRSGKGDEIRLGQRSTGNTGLEVSSDVRFLHANSKIMANEKDPRIGELRQEYAERDKAELRVLAVEHIREQVQSAYNAYRTVADKLQDIRRGLFGKREVATATPEVMAQLFATKDKEWEEDGVYDYVVEQLIEGGARFNLVASPDVEASEEQLVALAEDFGRGQRMSTYVYNSLFRNRHYSSREWSGARTGAGVRLSLIPDSFDSEISYRPAAEQASLLHARQVARPNLRSRVPSLLDALSYWYALRAGGDTLEDAGAFNRTYIRHFDLPSRVVGGWSVVPRSYVDDGGGPAWAARVLTVATGLGSRWGKNLSFSTSFSAYSFV